MTLSPIRKLVKKTKQIDPISLGRNSFTYVDISSVGKDSKTITNPQFLSVDEAPSRARKGIKANDVLVATVRPNLNGVAIVPELYDNEIASTGFCVLRTDETKLDPHYLFYFTQTGYFVNHLAKLSIGAGYPAVSDEDILDTEIPLPPLPEQRRIAALLSRLDRLRRLRRIGDTLSASLLQSVFLEMFGDPANNPKGWEVSAIEDLLSRTRSGIQTGPFGSSLKRHEYVSEGIPVWGINNLGENQFIEDEPLYITEEKFRQLKKYLVEGGDIFISRAGTVGKMCVAYPSVKSSIIGTNLIRISLDFSKVLSEYFTALFTYFGSRFSSMKMTADENAYSFINPSILRSMVIPVPPLPEQERFARVVRRVESLRARQAESARQGEGLFQSLLSESFRLV